MVIFILAFLEEGTRGSILTINVLVSETFGSPSQMGKSGKSVG